MSSVERLSRIEKALKNVNFNAITMSGIHSLLKSHNIPINVFEIILIWKTIGLVKDAMKEE